MKVKDLIEYLSKQDPEAVIIVRANGSEQCEDFTNVNVDTDPGEVIIVAYLNEE